MDRLTFANHEIYHIYNRGVEKRTTFLDSKDYFRFIHNLYEFNDHNSAFNSGRRFLVVRNENLLKVFKKPRKQLVEILCFVAMPNHYHLLLRQVEDEGITEFMRKIGTGYTNYFNLKYQRVGPLFQGKFKAVHVKKEAHLQYLPHYIHLNPLDLFMPKWREQKVSNTPKALEFLGKYRWSSYLDYINKPNFPVIIKKELLIEGRSKDYYQKEIRNWLRAMELESLRDIIIEH
jgi:putative transposase